MPQVWNSKNAKENPSGLIASALQSYLCFTKRGIGYGDRHNIFLNSPVVFRERHLDGAAKHFAKEKFLLKDDEEKEGEKTHMDEAECREYLRPFVGTVLYASPQQMSKESMENLGELAKTPERTLSKEDFAAISEDLQGAHADFQAAFQKFLEGIRERLEKAGVEVDTGHIRQFIFAGEHDKWELYQWFVQWDLDGMLERFLEAYDVWVEDEVTDATETTENEKGS